MLYPAAGVSKQRGKMNLQEVHTLKLNALYQFKFYYGGDDAYGILVHSTSDDKYYIIPPTKISDYNLAPQKIVDIGKLVNIATIASWAEWGRNPTSKEPPITIYGSPKATKLVILGAGASYDYCNTIRKTPHNSLPLANNLFSDDYAHKLFFYPGVQSLIGPINLSGDLEKFIQDKWNTITRHEDRRNLSKLINFQYYLHDLFMDLSRQHGKNYTSNYYTLTDLADQYATQTGEHVVFVNFNYDTLVETTMKKSFQYRFDNVNDYVDYQKRRLLLFKPHGSCNWVRKFNPAIAQHLDKSYNINSCRILSQLLHKANISFDILNQYLNLDFEILDYDEVIHACPDDYKENILYLPQLIFPIKEKDEFVMPSGSVGYMDYFLSNITNILIIGWKGAEENFQQLLSQKLKDKTPSITVVNYQDPSITGILNKSLPGSSVKCTGDTFSSYMKHCLTQPDHFFKIPRP
jgi:hypothetical protein